jgi:hypothetical protein
MLTQTYRLNLWRLLAALALAMLLSASACGALLLELDDHTRTTPIRTAPPAYEPR